VGPIAAHATPITDWLVKASFVIAAGLAWGTLFGLLARLATGAIHTIVYGVPPDAKDVPGYGEFIGVCSCLGGFGILLLWTIEYFGLI
jgi:hypothetical protein